LEHGGARVVDPGKAAAEALAKAIELDASLDAAHQLWIANLCRRGLGLEAVARYKALAEAEPNQPLWQGYLKTARLGAEFQANPVKVDLPQVPARKGLLARSIGLILAPTALNLGLAGVCVLLPLGLGLWLLFQPAPPPVPSGAVLGQLTASLSDPWSWLGSALAGVAWLAVLWARRPKRRSR
jgi:hypothetical protein